MNPKFYKAEYTGGLCARITTAASTVGKLIGQFNLSLLNHSEFLTIIKYSIRNRVHTFKM